MKIWRECKLECIWKEIDSTVEGMFEGWELEWSYLGHVPKAVINAAPQGQEMVVRKCINATAVRLLKLTSECWNARCTQRAGGRNGRVGEYAGNYRDSTTTRRVETAAQGNGTTTRQAYAERRGTSE